MAHCQEEYAAMQDALTVHGAGSPQYHEASSEYYECLRNYAAIAAGRSSHSAAWDEKLWLLHQEIQAAWEQLFEGVNLPPRPPCGPRSLEVRAEILSNQSTAMLFSKTIQEAFKKSGVALKDGETFACSVCVVKKPQYVSEALAIDPLGIRTDCGPRIGYIMEPAIMAAALDAVKRDTIDYGP
ncbi:hypothetical protein ACFLS5_02260 [Candidatus Bipolaricaulota bacterium]